MMLKKVAFAIWSFGAKRRLFIFRRDVLMVVRVRSHNRQPEQLLKLGVQTY